MRKAATLIILVCLICLTGQAWARLCKYLVSLLAELCTLTGELMVLGFTLWLLFRVARFSHFVLECFGRHIVKQEALAEFSLFPLATRHVEQPFEIIENAFAGNVEGVKAARLCEALKNLLVHRTRRQ